MFSNSNPVHIVSTTHHLNSFSNFSCCHLSNIISFLYQL
uniref:Uncharacterized protein n=1 Tax=Rhizophora mucronata TaxID=61149 RepID=A0A2P2NND3_RHIMU